MKRRVEFEAAEELIARYCRFLEHEGKRPLTIKNYRCDLKGYARWATLRKKREFNLGDVTPDHLKQYREWIIHGLTASSANRKLAALKGFLRWTADSGLLRTLEISELGNVKFVRKERFRPRCLDSTEQVRLLLAVESVGVARDITAIKLMLNTGIRASELCELRWNAVEISDVRWLLTFSRSKKTKKLCEARIPLNLEARNALISLGLRIHSGKDQLVFTGRSGPMTIRAVDMLIDRYSKIAGIKKLTPGILRHSFCMNMVNAGVSPDTIAKWMSHSSLQTTSCYYRPLPEDETAESMLTPPDGPVGL